MDYPNVTGLDKLAIERVQPPVVQVPIKIHLDRVGRSSISIEGVDISSHVSKIEILCDPNTVGNTVILTLPGAVLDVDGIAEVTGVVRRPMGKV